jgi:hypothetical protein
MFLSPLRGFPRCRDTHQGLTPLATSYRPYGTDVVPQPAQFRRSAATHGTSSALRRSTGVRQRQGPAGRCEDADSPFPPRVTAQAPPTQERGLSHQPRHSVSGLPDFPDALAVGQTARSSLSTKAAGFTARLRRGAGSCPGNRRTNCQLDGPRTSRGELRPGEAVVARASVCAFSKDLNAKNFSRSPTASRRRK